MNSALFMALLAFSVFRLILSQFFPITADESYYWLWSKHLASSYVDHPPMIAYIIFFFTGGQPNLLALRLAAALIAFLASMAIYFMAKEVFNEKTAFWSAILFQIIPHFLIVWLTLFVELPLVLFWTLSILILIKIMKTQETRLWYLLALALGAGCLSKYTLFLFWPCLLLYFYITPSQRFWIRKKEPYFCFLIALIIFSPVIFWNLEHQFASFAFHLVRTGSDAFGSNFPPFVLDQLIHFTPFLIFLLWPAFKQSLKQDEGAKLLFSFSAFPLLLFFVLSLKVKVWAHWPSLGYISALPLTVDYLTQKSRSALAFFFASIAVFSSLILIVLLWVSPAILPHQKDYAANYKLPFLLPQNHKIFAQTHVSASLFEFYTRRPVYLATGFLKTYSKWGERQYEIWGIPDLARGENILYFGEENSRILRLANQYFNKVSVLNIKPYFVEDYINGYKLFRLEGFRKNRGHP